MIVSFGLAARFGTRQNLFLANGGRRIRRADEFFQSVNRFLLLFDLRGL